MGWWSASVGVGNIEYKSQMYGSTVMSIDITMLPRLHYVLDTDGHSCMHLVSGSISLPDVSTWSWIYNPRQFSPLVHMSFVWRSSYRSINLHISRLPGSLSDVSFLPIYPAGYVASVLTFPSTFTNLCITIAMTSLRVNAYFSLFLRNTMSGRHSRSLCGPADGRGAYFAVLLVCCFSIMSCA